MLELNAPIRKIFQQAQTPEEVEAKLIAYTQKRKPYYCIIDLDTNIYSIDHADSIEELDRYGYAQPPTKGRYIMSETKMCRSGAEARRRFDSFIKRYDGKTDVLKEFTDETFQSRLKQFPLHSRFFKA